MWRKGFTFKAQTPHLRLVCEWFSFCVSCLRGFFFLLQNKPNILWIVQLWKGSTWLRSMLVWMIRPYIWTPHLRQIGVNPLQCLKRRSHDPPFLSTVFGLLQYLVWHFKVCYFWLFVSVSLFCLVSFILPRQSLSNKNLEAKFSQYFFFSTTW